jgi:hypothetical protein
MDARLRHESSIRSIIGALIYVETGLSVKAWPECNNFGLVSKGASAGHLPTAMNRPFFIVTQCSSLVRGTQSAEKAEFRHPAPEGASDLGGLMAPLKRCPDTKPNFRRLYDGEQSFACQRTFLPYKLGVIAACIATLRYSDVFPQSRTYLPYLLEARGPEP